MNRTISSRIQQLQRTDRKRVRQADPANGTNNRQEAVPPHKKAQHILGRREEEAEMAASAHRLAQVAMTAARNRCNQDKSSQRMESNSDESRFFAEIDKPLSMICGVCGERVNPELIKLRPYSSTSRLFQQLAVKTTEGRCRGLVEAGISMQGETEIVSICTRCDSSLSHRQLPKFCKASGFSLSPVPECLCVLNPMEARMLGLGVCFTTCFTLGHLGQSATRGNSINFWNDTYDVVTKLPRPASRCGVIRLKQNDGNPNAMYYPVRPWLLREALVWLKENNPIYNHVVVDEELLSTMPGLADVPCVPIDVADSCGDEFVENTTEGNSVSNEGDAFAESFVLEHSNETQREDDKILRALEGHSEDIAYVAARLDQPINEYATKLLMQSCFPTLFPNGFGGFHAIEGKEVRFHEYKLADYCCHLMAWHDRRFVMHPTFKFFCLNLIQRRQIDGLLHQVQRTDSNPVADAEIPDCDENQPTTHPSSSMNNVSKYLRALRPFFRSVRGTGLYWANVRDDLMSMIGNPALENRWPTFFVTLSAADTIWPDFFRVCNPDLSFKEAASLTPSQKRRYLNENPDLAAHHFHRRFQAFFEHILCGRAKPLGEIVDFFWRIEFQRRGSPHVHALLWMKDAPDILELSKTTEGKARLCDFADKFVSCLRRQQRTEPGVTAGDPLCKRPPPPSMSDLREQDLGELIERVQQHVCSSRSSCQRGGKCRFGYPKPLQTSTEVVRDVKARSIQIRFEHERDDDATNNYNPHMLVAWRANMDVKIIGNAYGAAEYTAAYISKAEPDTLRFRKTIESALAKLPNGVPYERLLQRTASTILAIREVSAQEAVYILSNTLCLFGKSRTVLKVKVSRHDRRYYRVEMNDAGQQCPQPLPPDTLKIEPIERAYMQRPRTPMFDRIPFREFCELYELSSAAPSDRQHLERWKLLDGRSFIKGRRKKQVIRPSPMFRVNEDNADYCYAQLFLHRPWRKLSDIAVADDAVCCEYRHWKRETPSPWVAHIEDSVHRQQFLDAAKSRPLFSPLQTGPYNSTATVTSMTTSGQEEINRQRGSHFNHDSRTPVTILLARGASLKMSCDHLLDLTGDKTKSRGQFYL